MTAVALLVVSAILWQEQFIDGVSSMNQLYDYSVAVVHEGEKVILRADSPEQGFAAAWFSIDYQYPFPDDAIVRLTMKVTENRARLRFFCQRHGHSVYYAGETSVAADEHWQTVDIELQDTNPFYSSNFPASLAPGKEPVLFLIIENADPGAFTVEVDDILVLEQQEEK